MKYLYIQLKNISILIVDVDAITLIQVPLVNGSQLAKMKKSIPDMSLPWNL